MNRFVLGIFLSAACVPAYALEATAAGESVAASNAGLISRLEATKSALTSTINQMLACNNKGKVFASNASTPGRDGDGCIGGNGFDPSNYEIVEKTSTVSLGNGTTGARWDTETINMTPYLNSRDVTIAATCDPCAWGDGGRGSVAIPSLKANWSGTVYSYPFRKSNYINGSYNASTKILTLQSGYSGDSTNSKDGHIANMTIGHTQLAIQEKAK